jgi:hypothetical protein
MSKMNKVFQILSLAVIVWTAASCGSNSSSCEQGKKNAADSGAVIHGESWATRNVDVPCTFAATPESTGTFYQWARKVGQFGRTLLK